MCHNLGNFVARWTLKDISFTFFLFYDLRKMLNFIFKIVFQSGALTKSTSRRNSSRSFRRLAGAAALAEEVDQEDD